MLVARAVLLYRGRMTRGDVADVAGEAVARVQRVEPAHHAISYDLRHDRRRCDRRALGIAVDDRPVRRSVRAEAEAVDEAALRRRVEVAKHFAKAAQVGAVEPVPVDRRGGNDTNRDTRRARHDRGEEALTLLGVYLFRVVQRRERPNAMPPQLLVVEQDASDDERPSQRTPTGLVRAGDIARAQPAIVA